jgi:protein-disulfide isomerase
MSHNVPADTSGDPYQLALSPFGRDHRQGTLESRVVLVEYGDYQCPQCRELYAIIKTIQASLNTISLDEKYLCFVFRHFPQAQIHPQAQKAATAAEAAGAQGQFWQMSEILWERHQELGDGYLVEYANYLGLDVVQFLRDVARGVYLDRINEDIASGRCSGVTSTPALFINGIRYRGTLNLEPLLAAMIEAGSLS